MCCTVVGMIPPSVRCTTDGFTNHPLEATTITFIFAFSEKKCGYSNQTRSRVESEYLSVRALLDNTFQSD